MLPIGGNGALQPLKSLGGGKSVLVCTAITPLPLPLLPVESPSEGIFGAKDMGARDEPGKARSEEGQSRWDHHSNTGEMVEVQGP